MIAYPARILAFREDMIKQIPRVPNDRASLETMRAMSTRELMSAFLTWRMRLIEARPRTVKLWSGGMTRIHFQAIRSRLRPLLDKVEAGHDLTPHLSTLVKTRGIVLPQARRNEQQRQDIDRMLIRHGLHHFHVAAIKPGNPKGRSGMLVFAEVLETEFRIVAVSDHSAFRLGTPEFRRISRIATAYVAREIPPGQAYLPHPVMSSGHSMFVMMFGIHGEEQIERLDPLLDDPTYIDSLYREHEIFRDCERVLRPDKPAFIWCFRDLKFGFLEQTTNTFFCLSPFFAR